MPFPAMWLDLACEIDMGVARKSIFAKPSVLVHMPGSSGCCEEVLPNSACYQRTVLHFDYVMLDWAVDQLGTEVEM